MYDLRFLIYGGQFLIYTIGYNKIKYVEFCYFKELILCYFYIISK